MTIPFTPAIYEHAAKLIGRTPWEVSRDPELIFAGHRAAWLEYQHSPIVVGIDIYNLEAEAYGAKITEPSGNGIPAVHEPPFASLDEAFQLKPYDPQRHGRIAMYLEVGQRLKAALPQADVRIPVSGPFSIAVSLRSITGLCEDAALRGDELAGFLLTLAENQDAFCRAVTAAGLDVAFFESAAAPPLLSPRLFRRVELPALQRVIAIAAGHVGHPVPCIMGGDTFRIYDDLMSTGTGYVVCNVETDQAGFVARARREHPQVRIRVNMDPGIVTCTERDRIRREVDRLVALIGDHPGCLIGTGALPYETPPENVHFISDYLSKVS